MRRCLLLCLQALALTQLGGNCEFYASSNNSIYRPEDEKRDGENQGLLVVINKGDLERTPPDAEAAVVNEADAPIDPNLTILLDGTIETLPENAGSASSPDTHVSAAVPLSLSGPVPLDRIDGPPAAAVPEPTALLLFAAGFAFTEWGRRRAPRRAARRRRDDARPVEAQRRRVQPRSTM